MEQVSDERRREVLRDTLELWRTDARVEALPPPGLARVRTTHEVAVRIARAEPSSGFRWMVHREGTPSPVAPRPCGSFVGVLSALRRAFDIDRGSPIRIGADPE